MSILLILKIVAAVATIATGAVSLFWPRAVFGFTGLQAPGGRGITEIRSILGGLFIGVGMAPFILNSNLAYQMLGIMYLAIGVVRLFSMFIDKSVVRSNVISLVTEVIIGLILIL